MPRRVKTIEQLRNLPQYRNKSDEELEEILVEILTPDTEERVAEVMKDFEKNYDLSDMSANDMLDLNNLAYYYVYHEDLSKQLDEEIRDGSTRQVDSLMKIIERVGKRINDIQTSLSITRKQRKGDKEEDIVAAWEDIKTRAKKLLQDRLSYIYCPKCKMLLANVWFLYPEEQKNAVRLRCNRIVDSDTGEVCGHEFTVTSKSLSENKNKNLDGVLPT
jgi:hypothetical protein